MNYLVEAAGVETNQAVFAVLRESGVHPHEHWRLCVSAFETNYAHSRTMTRENECSVSRLVPS
jgi:hypothetical protein